MAEEKDSGFRVTDRRKFNSDGSPRDVGEEPEASAAGPIQPLSIEPLQATEPQPANVLSFPGESGRKREPDGAVTQTAASASAAAEAPRAADAGDARAAQAKAAASAAEQAYNQVRGKPGGQIAGPHADELADASFLALVDMFAAEAAAHLGMAQTADGARTPVDLEAARHWIDLIGMLDEKTRGNLTAEEAGVLENVLAYLRMQFVGASRKR